MKSRKTLRGAETQHPQAVPRLEPVEPPTKLDRMLEAIAAPHPTDPNPSTCRQLPAVVANPFASYTMSQPVIVVIRAIDTTSQLQGFAFLRAS